jgi:hypothetical protein
MVMHDHARRVEAKTNQGSLVKTTGCLWLCYIPHFKKISHCSYYKEYRAFQVAISHTVHLANGDVVIQMIAWKQVRSELIRAIGYDPKTLCLYVDFHDGPELTYNGVPLSLVNEFLNAKSAGRFFNFYIKDKFPGE